MNPPQAYLDAFKALEGGDVERSVDIRISVEGGERSEFEAAIKRMRMILDPGYQPSALDGYGVRMGHRICAAALELWDEPEVSYLEGVRRFVSFDSEDPWIATTLWSAAIEKERLNEFRAAGVKRVEICGSGCDDDADVCRGSDGRVFDLSDAPELPHKVAEDETPCRCMFAAKYK